MSSTETATPDDEADGDADPFEDVAGREEILALLEDGIREAHRKVDSGRVRDAENEKVRISWIRTLAYAANAYRQLLRDEDLEEMDRRLTELEERADTEDPFL